MLSQELKIPDHFINRKVEKDIFQSLLQFKDEARLLAIEDKEGTGKSSLLKMLRYQSFYLYKKPVSIIFLEESTINSKFIFIERLRKGFGTRGKFTNFDALNKARVNKRSATFAPSSVSVSGTVDARNAALGGSGHQLAGVMINAPGTVVVNPAADWSSEQEEFARDECTKGFLADLKSIDETTVVLLDSYERCSLELKEWILEEFLWRLCFRPERPAHLVLVLAGRELPDLEAMLEQSQYKQLVRSSVLSMWEEEHVRAFLKVHGYDDLTPEDISYVYTKIQQGISISGALTIADTIRVAR